MWFHTVERQLSAKFQMIDIQGEITRNLLIPNQFMMQRIQSPYPAPGAGVIPGAGLSKKQLASLGITQGTPTDIAGFLQSQGMNPALAATTAQNYADTQKLQKDRETEFTATMKRNKATILAAPNAVTFTRPPGPPEALPPPPEAAGSLPTTTPAPGTPGPGPYRIPGQPAPGAGVHATAPQPPYRIPGQPPAGTATTPTGILAGGSPTQGANPNAQALLDAAVARSQAGKASAPMRGAGGMADDVGSRRSRAPTRRLLLRRRPTSRLGRALLPAALSVMRPPTTPRPIRRLPTNTSA